MEVIIMKNTSAVNMRTGLIIFMLAMVSFLVLPGNANARQELVAIESVNYNVSASMADNLRTLKGRTVNVTLASGKNMTGMLKDVGSELIHLEKLAGKENYDALINIDEINSVDTRFRAYKR
jgi:hypothetical protein